MKALALHVRGIVQGVGFRPFVYSAARDRGLAGWVLNASDGVHVLVQGDAEAIDAFVTALESEAPAMAVIDSVIAEEVEPEPLTGFEIRASRAEAGEMTLVSPDIATCPACLAELADPADRRFGYPFINCTNCGPRFTVIRDIPYDRPLTTMADFPLCPECEAEYRDPANRRFHAQPVACFVCGPRLYLQRSEDGVARAGSGASAWPDEWRWSAERETSPRQPRERASEALRANAIIAQACRLLTDGGILAIKGLGGFHLACDARCESAVARLRERKRRWGKPLAVMVADVEMARELAQVGAEEEALLTGAVRPIVLVRRGRDARGHAAASTEVPGNGLAEGVADGLAEVGVVLPYTPLHTLLLQAFGGPLVMTSGNASDEPIATENAEALARLSGIADAFLMHDRGIAARYDDSVVRVVERHDTAGGGAIVEPVRRARGFAPHPLRVHFASDTPILAVGPEQKNTFTLLTGDLAFVSQHIGDLETAETLTAFEQTIADYERLFRVTPRVIAHDLHPEYLSTKWALAQEMPTIGVQHHHAHIASVTAEHGIAEPVVGIAFDGTGYGADGHIWGGEVLVADWAGFERVAHLAEVPLVGGAAAIRRPARMALATLATFGLLDHPGAAPLRARLADGEAATLLRMIERGVNSPPTSSMGRLFDAVAALAGVRDDVAYEGEAAILLEAAADPAAAGAYEFALRAASPGAAGGGLVIDPAPVLASALDDLAGGAPAGVVSARFHRAVVRAIVAVGSEACSRAGTRHVALAGGVFMNRLVLGGAVRELSEAGYTPLTHVQLPTNDGAVSFGQAVVAYARRHEV